MLRKIRQSVLALLTNKYFGMGLVALAVLIIFAYLLVDRVIMPSYVRHDAYVNVPDVTNLPVEDATVRLETLDLRVEVESSRYNPQLPRNVVVDQNPRANFQVKPGRRVYLTINTGATPESTVPSLVGISLKDALNRLVAAGLTAEQSDIQEDSIPHPYVNMVTKQMPEPGKIVEEGSRVKIWYSTGLGTEYVNVPNLVGMTAREAQRFLLDHKLRSVVLGGNTSSSASELIVKRQSPTENTRIKEGFEIRLFVEPQEEDGEQN